ncbi:MAG: hypothetical protein QGG71_21000 [Pirellulaceae bacterium]|jgi:hypothetical protein|nr:hypothetical protein [Pirellulaceae bacterium]
MTNSWQCALSLDRNRRPDSGSTEELTRAIRTGADLRVGTAFRHNEHIDPSSESDELIREVMDFRITYLMEDRWVAGIENLRMPIALPDGFGPRESMSFFLYNQDGHQAIARPFFDERSATGQPGPSPINDWPEMAKYHELESFDADTNAPSSKFIYDFEYFHFLVRPIWREVLSHDADGTVIDGDVNELADTFAHGAEVKVAVRSLCDDLTSDEGPPMDHEVFVHLGACYYYTKQQLFMASANPVVRTRASIPLGYESCVWDFGWLMPRTDGLVARWLCDPYTLKFRRDSKRYAIRWYVSE